eukprot:TRINITY_DN824_c0_g1_i2.p1 TRINITY_DN824_c0_g1~~TRINITY_DN824_c0_g1_i2.p1  ORF type:complete len:503 (-),score=112.42 TRINITY_DN824_c0_g1_i2:298-1806(-)
MNDNKSPTMATNKAYNDRVSAEQTSIRKQQSLVFSTPNTPGALEQVLQIFRDCDVNLSNIDSLPNHQDKDRYDFFVQYETTTRDNVEKVFKLMKEKNIEYSDLTSESTPWFPRRISDLDRFVEEVLECGEELSSDHPGANDPVYRKRRNDITQAAKKYRHGDKLPHIEYTDVEVETWGKVYKEVMSLLPTHACVEYHKIFPLLEENCGYGENSIPQIEDISRFLKKCTGFTLRPVAGLLTSRDFLNGLAFRVFHSTQYIRHHSRPYYTPEPYVSMYPCIHSCHSSPTTCLSVFSHRTTYPSCPKAHVLSILPSSLSLSLSLSDHSDICHELIGHVPLFCDPDFADFSQEIGLASIGASDEDIKRLATCYWFTVEFGLCKQGKELKAYGAGLLSSFGELKYCLGGDEKKPEYRPFDPPVTGVQEYPITEYQPIYFITESFQKAQEQMREFSRSLDRPFSVHYNPYTESVEIVESKRDIEHLVKQMQSNCNVILDALSKKSFFK